MVSNRTNLIACTHYDEIFYLPILPVVIIVNYCFMQFIIFRFYFLFLYKSDLIFNSLLLLQDLVLLKNCSYFLFACRCVIKLLFFIRLMLTDIDLRF